MPEDNTQTLEMSDTPNDSTDAVEMAEGKAKQDVEMSGELTSKIISIDEWEN